MLTRKPEQNAAPDMRRRDPPAPAEAHAPPPPPPPPPPPAPAPQERIVLRGVHFDFNRANIRPDAAPILDEAGFRVLLERGPDAAREVATVES